MHFCTNFQIQILLSNSIISIWIRAFNCCFKNTTGLLLSRTPILNIIFSVCSIYCHQIYCLKCTVVAVPLSSSINHKDHPIAFWRQSQILSVGHLFLCSIINSILESKSYIPSSLKESLFHKNVNVLLDFFHSWTSVLFFSLMEKYPTIILTYSCLVMPSNALMTE